MKIKGLSFLLESTSIAVLLSTALSFPTQAADDPLRSTPSVREADNTVDAPAVMPSIMQSRQQQPDVELQQEPSEARQAADLLTTSARLAQTEENLASLQIKHDDRLVFIRGVGPYQTYFNDSMNIHTLNHFRNAHILSALAQHVQEGPQSVALPSTVAVIDILLATPFSLQQDAAYAQKGMPELSTA